MHAVLVALAEATPAPTDLPPDEIVTPGPWGFLAIGVIAIAVILLIWDMMRRIRRGRYRAEVREELDAEEAAARQADAAEEASDVDDEDISGHDERR